PISDDSFFAMITAFAKQHPEVRVQVDFSTRIVDLRRDGYDVALRAAAEIEPGLVARIVGRYPMIAVASPAYLAELGTPRTVKDLRKHRCLTGFARGELPQSSWPVGRGVVHVNSSFSSNDLSLLREAAVRGLGIAMLPRFTLADLLDNGALVHVLPGLVGTEVRLAVVYLEREFMAPHVRAFIDALIEWAPAFQRAADPRPAAGTRRRQPRRR
ncbi:MAG TPA: substrate binding domain-containing protein, partial [Enhygromyxa sp.]|nr:substrate binding domain-containing protein [Enhygromyxa sp.]